MARKHAPSRPIGKRRTSCAAPSGSGLSSASRCPISMKNPRLHSPPRRRGSRDVAVVQAVQQQLDPGVRRDYGRKQSRWVPAFAGMTACGLVFPWLQANASRCNARPGGRRTGCAAFSDGARRRVLASHWLARRTSARAASAGWGPEADVPSENPLCQSGRGIGLSGKAFSSWLLLLWASKEEVTRRFSGGSCCCCLRQKSKSKWIPAFAGMTVKGLGRDGPGSRRSPG